MDPLLIGLLSFVAILTLIFLGLHVGVALLIVSIGGLVLTKGLTKALGVMEYMPFNSIAAYEFAVFPLFVLMGELISASGVVDTLFASAQVWLGRLKGGLGMAVVAMGAALGAITGSALAALAMMTRVAFPQMLKYKYDAGVSSGLLAAVAPLALIIPPSIGLVLYGVLTTESIGKLLMAGLLPGLMSAVVYAVLIYVLARRRPQQWPTVARSFTWQEKVGSSKAIVPIGLTMLVVLGGIYRGVFTPSEAGAAGSVIALVLLVIYQRKKAGRAAFGAVWESAGMVSMIFFILIGSFIYGRFMSTTGATTQIINAIAAFPVSPYLTFALIIVFYIILGMFVDDFSMLAITLPVTHPLMIALGFDPIWFGVIAVILVGAATITPPFGIAVFAAKGLVGDHATLWSIFMGALPFLIAMMVVIVILTIFPQIALFLPSVMGK